ncbi:hypothetical protein GIB67_033183 [Kingdonia uniflora]|uniref:R13L1/DRL21-like LRR repeat region domain-containing protein n=2 Tax=Kingdonia uniflora TaxID=39325 RepID=A0A7J7NVE1_9MAGN|nr:hypothetical protein GIB67_033183 [Kingdonia uniflora]
MLSDYERRIPLSIWNLKSLRTLLVRRNLRQIYQPSIDCQDLTLLSHLTSLRTLDLSHTHIKELPKEVEKLIHLRLHRLPNGIGNLVNFRHLEFEGCSSLECLPRGIWKLRDLETLSRFIVSEEGADIGELKDLNNLRGSLVISNIKGIVKEAILKDNEYFHHLTLRFNDEAVKSVFELLEPHPNLEKLEVWYYNGSKFPSWMEFPNWEGRFIMLLSLKFIHAKT